MIIGILDTSVLLTGRFQVFFEQASLSGLFQMVYSEELVEEVERKRIEKANDDSSGDSTFSLSLAISRAKEYSERTRSNLEGFFLVKEDYEKFETTAGILARDVNDAYIEAMATAIAKNLEEDDRIVIVTEDKNFRDIAKSTKIEVSSVVTFLDELAKENPKLYGKVFGTNINPFVPRDSDTRTKIMDILPSLGGKKGIVQFYEPINTALRLNEVDELSQEEIDSAKKLASKKA